MCKSIICVGIVVTDLITASIYSTGVIDVLIDIWTHSNTRCYSNLCLLVIRNQCFYQPTKPLLASNGINMCSKEEFKHYLGLLILEGVTVIVKEI